MLSNQALGIILGAMISLLLAVAVLNLVLTLTRTAATCNFYRDLSGVPVTLSAQTHKPSPLSMEIIAHSREAYHGLGCTGTLPPPDPTFAHWAPIFHLPAG
jgi:hypothetical protein